jgi:hypothetical protein
MRVVVTTLAVATGLQQQADALFQQPERRTASSASILFVDARNYRELKTQAIVSRG